MTQQDKLAWHRLLSSEPGERGLSELREATPSISADVPDKMIFFAGRSQGWTDCIRFILDKLANREKDPEQIDIDS